MNKQEAFELKKKNKNEKVWTENRVNTQNSKSKAQMNRKINLCLICAKGNRLQDF